MKHVLGPVGAGKTSLLSAILGEMYQLSGSKRLNGTLAFSSQQSWIVNNTVRYNILMVQASLLPLYLSFFLLVAHLFYYSFLSDVQRVLRRALVEVRSREKLLLL